MLVRIENVRFSFMIRSLLRFGAYFFGGKLRLVGEVSEYLMISISV